METLANRLTGIYSESNGWAEIKNNHQLWLDLHREMLDNTFSKRPKPSGPHYELPPRPPLEAGWLSARSVLLDKNKQHIIGGPSTNNDAPILRPIISNSDTIGYLGLFPSKELMDARDLLFIKQQTQSFGLIALVMLAISLLLTFPITSHLLKPIKHLTRGTQKLSCGRYTTRIPIYTRDELGRLSKDFNTLATTLERNEIARQEWLADISHELRTPLSLLRMEIEAIRDGIMDATNDNIDRIYSESLHLQRLVDDLFELTLSDLGALNYRKTPIHPIAILEESLESFDKRFNDKGLHIQRTFLPAQASPIITGDPDRLYQLYTNLLENSLRYTDAPGTLNIKAQCSNTSLILSFSDSAPGADENQLPHLFKRLYRVDSSRSRIGGGAGLGLSICKNIVEAHQGTITASKSDIGGLTITTTLPLHV